MPGDMWYSERRGLRKQEFTLKNSWDFIYFSFSHVAVFRNHRQKASELFKNIPGISTFERHPPCRLNGSFLPLFPSPTIEAPYPPPVPNITIAAYLIFLEYLILGGGVEGLVLRVPQIVGTMLWGPVIRMIRSPCLRKPPCIVPSDGPPYNPCFVPTYPWVP